MSSGWMFVLFTMMSHRVILRNSSISSFVKMLHNKTRKEIEIIDHAFRKALTLMLGLTHYAHFQTKNDRHHECARIDL